MLTGELVSVRKTDDESVPLHLLTARIAELPHASTLRAIALPDTKHGATSWGYADGSLQGGAFDTTQLPPPSASSPRRSLYLVFDYHPCDQGYHFVQQSHSVGGDGGTCAQTEHRQALVERTSAPDELVAAPFAFG